jgi:hypothetical protein
MVSRTFSSSVSRRAASIESHRSFAVRRSGRAASGCRVASTNRRSACSCAGSTSFAGTGTTTTWRKSASGHGPRSINPVSSRPSRRATATGSPSPGSPWPPTCNQACCRSCHRSSTRLDGGWTTSADAVTWSAAWRSHGEPAATNRRTRRTSLASDAVGSYMCSRSLSERSPSRPATTRLPSASISAEPARYRSRRVRVSRPVGLRARCPLAEGAGCGGVRGAQGPIRRSKCCRIG